MLRIVGLLLVSVGMWTALAATADGVSCCTKKSEAAASCCAATPDKNNEPATPGAAHDHQASTEGAPACCAARDATSGAAAEPRRMGGRGRGAVMPDAMHLLHGHAAIERTTEDLPNGVKTRTTTQDPDLLAVLRRHPREMYSYYESGGSVRPHDPMFRELSRVADKVKMEFVDIENGIEVIATSEDADVVKLLRAHAAKVSEFVKRGMPALHEGAPLPSDYTGTK